MKITQYKKQALFLAVLLLPALLILLAIIHYGVNTPFWDDWEMVPLFQKVDRGTLAFSDLWAQHNEHRILFPNIVLLVSAYMTHWNLHFELLISFAFSLVSVMLLYLMLRSRFRTFGFALIATAALSIWFYSPIQWQNWLWGWQVEWFMCVAGVVAAIYFLDRLGQSSTQKTFLLIAASCSALVATFSLGSGILIWPLGLGIMFLYKRRRKEMITWGLSGVASALLYYYHYQKPAGSPPLTTFIREPVGLVKYFLTLVGGPFGGTMDLRMLMGGLLVLILVPLGYFVWIRRKQIYLFMPWISLIVFSLMVDLITAISRLGLGVAQSMNSRYTAVSLLLTIGFTGLILTILDNLRVAHKYKIFIWLCLAAVVLPLLWSSYVNGIEGMQTRSTYLRYIAACTRLTNPSSKCLSYTYPNPDLVRTRLVYLKQKHWSGY